MKIMLKIVKMKKIGDNRIIPIKLNRKSEMHIRRC